MLNFRVKLECAVCPAHIWKRSGSKLKKAASYREVEVRLNNLSRMVVGVCPRHTSPTKDELKIITKKTRQGWQEEVALGIGEETWVREKGMKLTVTGIA